MSNEKVIIDFKRHAYLLDLEKAMRKKTVVIYERGLQGLYRGDPRRHHTVTFHDPKEVQEKLIEKLEDLEQKLRKEQGEKYALERKLSSVEKELSSKQRLLKETYEGLKELQYEANKSLWKTFKEFFK